MLAHVLHELAVHPQNDKHLQLNVTKQSIALQRLDDALRASASTMNNQSIAGTSNSAMMSPSAGAKTGAKTPASTATSTGAYDDAHRISPAGKLVLRGGLKRKHT